MQVPRDFRYPAYFNARQRRCFRRCFRRFVKAIQRRWIERSVRDVAQGLLGTTSSNFGPVHNDLNVQGTRERNQSFEAHGLPTSQVGTDVRSSDASSLGDLGMGSALQLRAGRELAGYDPRIQLRCVTTMRDNPPLGWRAGCS